MFPKSQNTGRMEYVSINIFLAEKQKQNDIETAVTRVLGDLEHNTELFAKSL